MSYIFSDVLGMWELNHFSDMLSQTYSNLGLNACSMNIKEMINSGHESFLEAK